MYKTVFPPKNITPDAIEFLNKIIDKIVNDIYITKYDKESRYWKEWAPFLYILTRHYYNNQSAKDIFDFVENLLEDDMYIQLHKIHPSDSHAMLACIMGHPYNPLKSDLNSILQNPLESIPSTFMAQLIATDDLTDEQQDMVKYINQIISKVPKAQKKTILKKLEEKLKSEKKTMEEIAQYLELFQKLSLFPKESQITNLNAVEESFLQTISEFETLINSKLSSNHFQSNTKEKEYLNENNPTNSNVTNIQASPTLQKNPTPPIKIANNSINIFGGIDTIGGNKVLVEGITSSILLDFGLDIGLANQFFTQPYLSFSKDHILFEAIQMGLLPAPVDSLQNLYDPLLYEDSLLKRLNIVYTKTPPRVKYVFISHIHIDHIGLIQYLHPSIKIICSLDTYELIDSFSKQSTFKNILSCGGIPREFIRIQTNADFKQLEGFDIRLITADHSVPGAAMIFLIDQSTKKKFFYTGDFRTHGFLYSDKVISEIINFAPEYIITEGTNISSTSLSKPLESAQNELQIQSEFYNILNQPSIQNSLLLYQISNRDYYRLISLGKASSKLPPSTQKIILVSLEKYDQIVKILNGADLTQSFSYISNDEKKAIMRLFKPFEMDTDDKSSLLLSYPDIVKEPHKYCIPFSLRSAQSLLALKDQMVEAHFIFSTHEWDEDDEISDNSLRAKKEQAWYTLLGIKPENIHRIHTTGHISPLDFSNFFHAILSGIHAPQPITIIPIHTKGADQFASILSDLKSAIKIIIPNSNHPISLK